MTRRRRPVVHGPVVRGPVVRGLVVVALVALLAALPVTVVRLGGWDLTTPTAQLVGLTPLAGLLVLLATVLLGTATALGGRRSRWLLAPAVAALVLHVAWALPAPQVRPDGSGTPATASARPADVTVMTVNARLGRADAGQLVAEVRSRDVDVLLVQELTAGLAGRLRDAGLEEVLPHGQVRVLDAATGAATWSRWPQTALTGPSTTFATVRSVVEVPGGGPLTVTNVHPWPPLPGTEARWRADHDLLRGAVGTTDGAHVVAGDLNATPHHSLFRRLLDAGLVDPADGRPWRATWPADRAGGPVVALDHVLVDPSTAVTTVGRVRVGGTDHLAVVAHLALG